MKTPGPMGSFLFFKSRACFLFFAFFFKSKTFRKKRQASPLRISLFARWAGRDYKKKEGKLCFFFLKVLLLKKKKDTRPFYFMPSECLARHLLVFFL